MVTVCGGALTVVGALDGGGDSFGVKVRWRGVDAEFIALYLFLFLALQGCVALFLLQ